MFICGQAALRPLGVFALVSAQGDRSVCLGLFSKPAFVLFFLFSCSLSLLLCLLFLMTVCCVKANSSVLCVIVLLAVFECVGAFQQVQFGSVSVVSGPSVSPQISHPSSTRYEKIPGSFRDRSAGMETVFSVDA